MAYEASRWDKLGLAILEMLGLNESEVYRITIECGIMDHSTISIVMDWAQNESIEIDWQYLDKPVTIEITGYATQGEAG